MNDWQAAYQSKLVTPEAALAAIRSGDRVYLSFGVEPQTLVTALAGRAGDLRDVEVIASGASEQLVWSLPGFEGSFQASIETMGLAASKEALATRRAGYYPTLFSKTFKAFDERPDEALPIDVCLCTVSLPDAGGLCSFGLSLWHRPSFARRARLTIAEVDPDLPRARGDNAIHVSEIDYFVEKQALRPARVRSQPEEHTRKIAGFVAELIRDGDTLQIGAGSASSRLSQLGIFDGKRDLGWHSESTQAGVITAVRQGIITGARKTLNRGKLVTTTLVIAPEERAFAENNPDIELREVTYTNDIQVIAAHDNMVAINNALAIDLTGQITAESLGPHVWRGMGGQPEFAAGAFLSRGGRSITVLPSVTSSGISRICGHLEPGTFVTVPRYFADTIVTEWGVARLLGKSQRQRALELINIAHPDHRAGLKRIAEKLFWP
jgi:4-hydroxybutyrate CoA-transferase